MEVCGQGTIILLVTTFLSSTLGAPTISVDANHSNYGSTEILKCTEASYLSGNGYFWEKDGVVIYTQAGEESTTGKYNESIDETTFMLVINDIDVGDEGTYSCNHAFAYSNLLNLTVESRGIITSELSSSQRIIVTFKQIYPSIFVADITCDSIDVDGFFVSTVADEDRFIVTWESTKRYYTVPSSCSASVNLRTEFDTAFSVISAIITEIFKCFLLKDLVCVWKCVVMAVIIFCVVGCFIGIIVGIAVEFFFDILGNISSQFWKILLFFVFLIGFGLWLCYWIKRIIAAICYVVIQFDGTWSLGASIGAFCVTKVTPGGPADGKLKVGDHIYAINEETLTGKDPNLLKTAFKSKTKLTLRVLKVGSTDTSPVELNYKQEEQLGFDFENLAMVTDVTEGSKAHRKLKKGHLILSINGKSTAGNSIGNVNKELKNPPKVLELSLKRGEMRKQVSLHFNDEASSGITIKKEKENIVVSAIKKESAASGDVEEKDCILSVNGVSTAGLKVADIKEMLTFSIVLKVTKDVTVLELDPDLNGSIGVKNASANTVISVKAKGPATFAGIQVGDEILEIDDQSTDTMTVKQIAEMISSRGKTVRFKIARGEVTVEREEFGSLGFELSSTPNVVYKVDGNAALSQKVKVGDEILEIDDRSTDTMTVDQIAEMIASGGQTVRFKIARGEVTVERDIFGSLGLELSSTPNVVYKVDGNAALSQKVKAGDTIVTINDKKTKGKSHQEIKTMLESSGGSISLKIQEAVNENCQHPDKSGRNKLEASVSAEVEEINEEAPEKKKKKKTKKDKRRVGEDQSVEEASVRLNPLKNAPKLDLEG